MKPAYNPYLSIVIPSYNRADFLDRSLAVHVPMAQRHNVQIFISNNASTDNTQDVVDKWKSTYGLINCLNNNTTVSPDENFEKALKAPDTQYVWLLGDTSQIPEHGIESILNLESREQTYDAIIVNLIKKNQTPSTDYDNPDLLLTELGGIMSCMSCLIYSKTLITSADFSRYIGSYFMQTGVILERAAQADSLIRWEQGISIQSLESKGLLKKSWAHTPKIFEIGVEKWVNFIFSLSPRYQLNSKLLACKSFGKVSGAFSVKGLLSLRARGLLSYSVCRQFKHALKLSIDYPWGIVILISLIPQFFLNATLKMYLLIFRRHSIEHDH
ncbi:MULTISPECIES: glycosyltransferase [Pseudomonas]|uniref:glycosyltransferase family 2 protein n=1 Tax=Pseudomonas TaxID=286 RepID=UPI000CFB1397|nr:MULTISPECIES: glycosyltransferase [Pseudomonas]PQZ91869.1 transferase [Pseudomonas trivialis]PRB27836.1 transferase [Pseudomonas sp. MYb60]